MGIKAGCYRSGAGLGQRGSAAQDVGKPSVGDVWTPDAVREVLKGAARVIMTTPLGPRDKPMDVRALWPGVLQNKWDVGVNEDGPKVTRLKPSARMVDHAETAIAWLMFIDNPRDRRVIGARIFGARWKPIARVDGRNPEYLRGEFFQRHLAVISRRLQAEKKNSPSDLAHLARFG